MDPYNPCDPLGAFRILFKAPIRGTTKGSLTGRSFAVKDLFDVEGYFTGCGNPDWERTHPKATKTSDLIHALLDQGAVLVGKTHTDELAYSLNGENTHFGTPKNPQAPGRIPGGSSSGSASAVAGGLVDFAIGTDTGGSVRIPASYCGLYGMRPTHGRVSLRYSVALAPSFDTAGWFTRTASDLVEVGRILLARGRDADRTPKLLFPEKVFELCDQQVSEALIRSIVRIDREMPVQAISWDLNITELASTFRTLQGFEAWQVHGRWIEETRPTFGPGIRERFEFAASISEQEYDRARAKREAIRIQLSEVIAAGHILLWPTAPCVAPALGMTHDSLDPIRKRILALTCVAGLGGFPQLTIPAASAEGCPVGLSLLGTPGQDMSLLKLSVTLADVLK
jgi:amidase